MIELPDDELDKLFRKSAEEFDPTFDPQDWNKLRKKLDEEDGHRPGFFWFRKWWPLLLAGFVFLGLTGVYLVSKESKISTINIGKTIGKNEETGNAQPNRGFKEQPVDSLTTLNNDKKIKPAISEPIVSGSTISTSGSETSTAAASNEKVVKADKKAAKIKPRGESKASGVFLESDYSKNKSGAGAISLIKSSKNSGLTQKRADVATREGLGFKKADEKLASGNDAKSTDINSKLIDQPAKSSSFDKDEEPVSVRNPLIQLDVMEPMPFDYNNKLSIGGPGIPKIQQKEQTEEPQKSVKTPSPKFAVRFGVSPDLSSVQFMKGIRVGNAVSLLGEYAIVPRLYIQAGAIRSLKKYQAGPGDYEWPGSWTQPVMPESVDAVCKIIEIPLNLRFDISSTQRQRWFVSAGASSYQMKDEKYDYNYKKHVPGIKWYKWQGETGWYWFSHLNASVGYEYRVSSSLSLMAEPYVNVPIKKVGFGQVNLFTTGIWISIRYSPFKK